jgi:hypothetical protein
MSVKAVVDCVIKVAHMEGTRTGEATEVEILQRALREAWGRLAPMEQTRTYNALSRGALSPLFREVELGANRV